MYTKYIKLNLNTLRLRQNGRHSTDNIFKCISLNEICSLGSNWQYDNIVSDNGLALNRPRAINWTNGGLGYQRIYTSLSLNELKPSCLDHWIHISFPITKFLLSPVKAQIQ